MPIPGKNSVWLKIGPPKNPGLIIFPNTHNHFGISPTFPYLSVDEPIPWGYEACALARGGASANLAGRQWLLVMLSHFLCCTVLGVIRWVCPKIGNRESLIYSIEIAQKSGHSNFQANNVNWTHYFFGGERFQMTWWFSIEGIPTAQAGPPSPRSGTSSGALACGAACGAACGLPRSFWGSCWRISWNDFCMLKQTFLDHLVRSIRFRISWGFRTCSFASFSEGHMATPVDAMGLGLN